MKNFWKKIVAITGAVIMLVVMSACTTVNTAPDAVALHYSGGILQSQKFVECVPASSRNVNGPGEHYYYYPVGQRTYSFTGRDNGGETDPIQTNTKDSQQVAVSGFVTFELNVDIRENEDGVMDCPELREFHERIGYKAKAYFEGNPDFGEVGVEGEEKSRQAADNQEWRDFLNQYLKTPLDMVMDDNGQQHSWRDLFQNQETQNEFRDGVARDLPIAVNTALGSSEFFTVNNVTISTPQPSQVLLEALKDTEAAKEQNNAQIERNKVSQTKYASMTECMDSGLSEKTCLTLKVVEEGDIPIYIIPEGQDVLVNAVPSGNTSSTQETSGDSEDE